MKMHLNKNKMIARNELYIYRLEEHRWDSTTQGQGPAGLETSTTPRLNLRIENMGRMFWLSRIGL